MRLEISDQALDLAYEKASPEIVIFLSNINDNDALIKALIDLKLPESDARQIKRELTYVALGLARLDEFGENVLANTEGDEELVNFAIDFIEDNIIPEAKTIISTYQININSPAQTTNASTKRTSADILLRELGTNDPEEDDTSRQNQKTQFIPSKHDLLAEIEKPIETTNTPIVPLPKTKPAAADILKGLVNAPYSMSDTVKIMDDNQTITIIDPLKRQLMDKKAQDAEDMAKNKAILTPSQTPAPKTPESTIISSNDPTFMPKNQNTDVKSVVIGGLDKKLSTVVKTMPTESYKLAGKDPYREPPTA